MNEARQGNKFLLRCREIKLQCSNHQKLSYNNIISYIFKLIKKKKNAKSYKESETRFKWNNLIKGINRFDFR